MSSDSASKLATFGRLCRQLDARRQGGGARTGEERIPLGLGGVDEALGGGLPRGALTELVFVAPSSGGQMVVLHLLHVAQRMHRFLALIDGADGFDPQTIEPEGLLRHLLWVRCHGTAQALQAADLIARDTNFVLLALDLRGCAPRELRRTPPTVWYRLQRVLEPTSTALVILTPQRLVPSAQARLIFNSSLPLACLTMQHALIGGQLAPAAERVRTQAAWQQAEHAPAAAYPNSQVDSVPAEEYRIVAEDGLPPVEAAG